jgi:methylglutaconyl-CoA hydratase
LNDIAGRIAAVSKHPACKVVVIRSEGAGSFCAGASFDELKRIDTPESGKEFFMGFARVILAMRRCPKPIISRVHGKVVGGGVGIVAASDYVLAVPESPARLSELAVGLGPFVVGPAIERKVGAGAFSAMSLDADWRDAQWCLAHNLYTRICDNVQALDQVLGTLSHKLAAFNPEAITALKQALWEGTDSWEQLLEDRAAMSGRLVLSEFTRNAIAAFEKR